MSHNTYRPQIGGVQLLVYRECRCGEWCATGEGAKPPRCSDCGTPMWPLGTATTLGGQPMFGSDRREQRRMRGLGFIALFTNEITAAELIGSARKLLGIQQADFAHRDRRDTTPYAAKGEVSRDLEETQ